MPGLTPVQYTGQRAEPQLGILYYKARWYDGALGRFLQPDTLVPVASQGVTGHDRYAAMNNNPLRFNDPSGHDVGCGGKDCSQSGAYLRQPTRTPVSVQPSVVLGPIYTPKPTGYAFVAPTQTATSMPPMLDVGSSPTPTPTQTLTPTPVTPVPTLNSPQEEALNKGVQATIDIMGEEGMNLIHFPTFIGMFIDAKSQYDKDSGKGMSWGKQTARALTVAVEGNFISHVSTAAFGIGGGVTLESGPVAIGVAIGLYAGTSSVLSLAGNELNRSVFFPAIDLIDMRLR
jgi:RHS repeat-associated protein